jgi:hypothetical protein
MRMSGGGHTVLMTVLATYYWIVEQFATGIRERRGCRSSIFEMIGARHPPMIGVLRVACVLALIWAQEENSECGYCHVVSPLFNRRVRRVTGPSYGKS